ncbi:MAG: hypothetical protein JSV30_05245 [Candidatus Omnitrophota bacterium]|nr:MAG: hypothetical protein JSV30_05245 [Candidatus Omnitrophota bacterium]
MAKSNLKTFILVLLSVFLVGLFVNWLCTENKEKYSQSLSVTSPVEVAQWPLFATEERLIEHFRKHGAEFGYKHPNEYLWGAQKLISAGEGVLTHSRSDGDKLFYHPGSNEFAVLSARGYIRTYFKPNSGYQYWQRQIGAR